MQTGLLNLPENKRNAISEFIRILRDSFGDRVKKVILFGSVARGDFNDESDIGQKIILLLQDCPERGCGDCMRR